MNQTSLETYFKETKKRAPQMQNLILSAIKAIQPCSNQQIAEYLFIPINSVTGRVLELRQQDKVVSCFRAPNEHGRTVNFWCLKEYRDKVAL